MTTESASETKGNKSENAVCDRIVSLSDSIDDTVLPFAKVRTVLIQDVVGGEIDDFADRRRHTFRSQAGFVLRHEGRAYAQRTIDDVRVDISAHFTARSMVNNGQFQELFGVDKSFIGFLGDLIRLQRGQAVAVSNPKWEDGIAPLRYGKYTSESWSNTLQIYGPISAGVASKWDGMRSAGLAVCARRFADGTQTAMSSAITGTVDLRAGSPGFAEAQRNGFHPVDPAWDGSVFVPSTPDSVQGLSLRTGRVVDMMERIVSLLQVDTHADQMLPQTTPEAGSLLHMLHVDMPKLVGTGKYY